MKPFSHPKPSIPATALVLKIAVSPNMSDRQHHSGLFLSKINEFVL